MKKLALAFLIVLSGCFSRPAQKNVAILLDAVQLTSMGTTYTVWTGITEDGKPATGIIRKKQDLRFGDVIVVEKYASDNTWTYIKRINANR